MTTGPGDTVLIDWPGSDMHNKKVRVAAVVPAYNIAPEGAPKYPVTVVIVEHPVSGNRLGIGPAMIAGTVEAVARRRYDTLDGAPDNRQGDLLL